MYVSDGKRKTQIDIVRGDIEVLAGQATLTTVRHTVKEKIPERQ